METDGKVNILSSEIPRYSRLMVSQPFKSMVTVKKPRISMEEQSGLLQVPCLERTCRPSSTQLKAPAQSALLGALTLLRANFRAHDKYQDKTGSLCYDILRRVKVKWL